MPFAALALAACATVSAHPTSDVADGDGARDAYFALGSEPGWTLEITSARLNYVGDYGDTRIAEANPGARAGFNGRLYQGDRLIVDVTHAPCRDGLSDRRYADSVTVSAEGKRLRGCGGAVLPPADLSGTRWTMVAIDGREAIVGIATSLTFDRGQLVGNAGCNSFSGEYWTDGSRLTAQLFEVTLMGCGHSVQMQEDAAISILSRPVSVRFAADGTMILTSDGGRSIVLEQII